MRSTLFRSLFVCAALLVVLAPARSAEDKDGFTPLFNGTDLAGWQTRFVRSKLDTSKTFTVKGGVMVVSGHPNGLIYTDKSYKDYVLRYDWRYKRPASLKDDARFTGNSGLLFHVQAPEKGFSPKTIWPQCVEAQGRNSDHGKLFFMGTEGKGTWDKAAKEKATRKVGEWNTTEVTCKADGSITVKINGVEVASGKSPLTEGRVGFQSEGAEIHFRNIKIKPQR